MSDGVLFLVVIFAVLGAARGDDVPRCMEIANSTDNLDDLPQDRFIYFLTDPCRYDKYYISDTPRMVKVKMDLTHMEAAQSQFTSYMTVHFVYVDENLNYENFTSTRDVVFGDEDLKDKIWVPNVLLKEQNQTTVLGMEEKDVLISIQRNGKVTYSYQMIAKFDCWMDLKKFPFDSQACHLAFSDWSNNQETVQLIWDKTPLTISSKLHFTEFNLDAISSSSGTNDGPYRLEELAPIVGKFSELRIHLDFHRDVGYYLLDFFIPSILLVFTAWVTFWLQADAGPPRATLGASTIVAFITLHLGVSKDIPKVSYVKASDIWFLGVTCFIFLSLAEFAFVNVIWRRRKQVELKKPKHKYIIKSAVMPKKAREDLKRSTQSLSVISDSYTDLANGNVKGVDSVISIPDEIGASEFTWTTMTPQEVAIYVDRKARIVFPIAFFLFNAFYWTFVYCS